MLATLATTRSLIAGWSPVWIDLPILAVTVLFAIVTIMVIRRTPPDDVPKVYSILCSLVEHTVRAMLRSTGDGNRQVESADRGQRERNGGPDEARDLKDVR